MMMAQCAEKIPHPSSGFFPQDTQKLLVDNSLGMTGNFSSVIARIESRQAALGLSDRELSLRAVGKPDLVRDMRRREGLPRGDRLAEIARVLGTTSDWLLYGGEPGEAERRAEAQREPVRSEVAGAGLAPDSWRPLERAKPVPLVGSAIGGAFDEIAEHVELTELHLGEVLDYLARPPSLASDPDAYAVTVVGDSMAPRFEPGERAFVSPRSSVGIGDDVVVQLKGEDDRVTMVLIKRLVRRGGTTVELAQFNPAMTFAVPAAQVAAIHRVKGRL
jgi:phage repressor protein C with HTH and peptisase S24 domain